MNTLLANAVAIAHSGLVAFFALGWLLPWRVAWMTVLIGGIGLFVIWQKYENNCPLTALENRLRGRPINPSQPRFVGTLVSKVTGLSISNRTADSIAYLGLLASMIICVIRIAN